MGRLLPLPGVVMTVPLGGVGSDDLVQGFDDHLFGYAVHVNVEGALVLHLVAGAGDLDMVALMFWSLSFPQ